MLLRWSSGAAHSVAAAVPASGGLQRRPAALPLHCRPGGQDDHITLASQWSDGDLWLRDGCPAGEQCAAWLHLHHQVKKIKILFVYIFVFWVKIILSELINLIRMFNEFIHTLQYVVVMGYNEPSPHSMQWTYSIQRPCGGQRRVGVCGFYWAGQYLSQCWNIGAGEQRLLLSRG